MVILLIIMKNNKKMNKKILLGCIGTIVIIMLASFSSVIGGQTKNLSGMENSPLFHIRTLRTTEKSNGDAINTGYIGKEKSITLSFSTHSNTQLFFQKAIESLTKLDEASFNNFLETAVNKLQESKMVIKEDVPRLKELFHFLRENPDEVKNYPLVERKNEQLELWTSGCQTVNCYTLQDTPILCFMLIVTFPLWFSVFMLYYLYLKFRDSRPTIASFGCP